MFKSKYCEIFKKKPFIEHIFNIIRDNDYSLYITVGTKLEQITSLNMFANNLYNNFIILKEINIGARTLYVQILKYENGNLIFINEDKYFTSSNLKIFDVIDFSASRKFYGYKKISNSLYYEPVLYQNHLLKDGYSFDAFKNIIITKHR